MEATKSNSKSQLSIGRITPNSNHSVNNKSSHSSIEVFSTGSIKAIEDIDQGDVISDHQAIEDIDQGDVISGYQALQDEAEFTGLPKINPKGLPKNKKELSKTGKEIDQKNDTKLQKKKQRNSITEEKKLSITPKEKHCKPRTSDGNPPPLIPQTNGEAKPGKRKCKPCPPGHVHKHKHHHCKDRKTSNIPEETEEESEALDRRRDSDQDGSQNSPRERQDSGEGSQNSPRERQDSGGDEDESGHSEEEQEENIEQEDESGHSEEELEEEEQKGEAFSERAFVVIWDESDEDEESDFIPFCSCCRPELESQENCCMNDSDNDDERGNIPDFGIFRKITVERNLKFTNC